MMECKAMTTPMASKLEILSVASSEMVDSMIYHQIICSLMYLMNTTPDIWFVMNTLRHVHVMVAKHVVRYLRVQLSMGSSMKRIKRLTWRVMWIQIGQVVPLIGREIQGVYSV